MPRRSCGGWVSGASKLSQCVGSTSRGLFSARSSRGVNACVLFEKSGAISATSGFSPAMARSTKLPELIRNTLNVSRTVSR